MTTYIWMNINAFFTVLALRKVRAFFLWMEVWAFLIWKVAIRKVPAFDLLFIFLMLIILLLLLLLLLSFLWPFSDVVLVLTEIYYCIAWQIQFHLFKLLLLLFLLTYNSCWCFLDPLMDFLFGSFLQSLSLYQCFKVNIDLWSGSLVNSPLLLQSVKDISFLLTLLLFFLWLL